MKKKEKQTLSNWLEILQQESWHLELLISGFAIFLLVGARDPLNLFIYNSSVTSTGIIAIDLALTVPSIILIGSWFVLLINLIVHVMFRGLWVSTIGLRYVSGDIDFDSLELTPKFKSFLEHRIINFDTFINRLEKLCSSIFGFTFLIIFVIISTGLFFFFASGLILLSEWSPPPMDTFFEGVVFVYFAGGGIYLIDFITFGWLKKLPKIGRLYFPLYLFYSLITLSFIYRPLYYNLIDNKFGRKVVLFLIPYGLLFFIYNNIFIETHKYLPSYALNQTIETNFYDDTWDQNTFLQQASLPSLQIEKNYLEVFLPYLSTADDPIIKNLCPDLIPAETGVFLFNRDTFRLDPEKALSCHSQRFELFIDGTLTMGTDFWFYKHPQRKAQGILAFIDLTQMKPGKHLLTVGVYLPKEINWATGEVKEPYLNKDLIIPFWKM